LYGYYDLWTVFCSFVIAFLAGFAAFEAVDHVRAGASRWGWVLFGGATLARIGVGNAMLFTFALLVVSYRDKALWIQKASLARIESEESARKLEALATAGKIAASVAHEINNPLEAVTNLLYLAQLGEVGESEREYLTMAQKELGRIASITTHTLRFYRQQSAPGPVSIPELLESALVLFQTLLAGQKIVVVREWPERVPLVVCREGEIRQVIANLIGNAIDAMPDGGKLRLAVRPVAMGIEVEIADTGAGIPADVQDRILELSIAAEILARHGRTLRFGSGGCDGDGAEGGACFRFFLPFGEAAVGS
jgi:signal transduction histidine kinase